MRRGDRHHVLRDANPPPGSGCSAARTATDDWGSGFTADVTVTSGSSAFRGWTVSWTYGGSQHVTDAWNATVSRPGASATVVNAPWNGWLGASASTGFGFRGTGSGAVPTLTCTAS